MRNSGLWKGGKYDCSDWYCGELLPPTENRIFWDHVLIGEGSLRKSAAQSQSTIDSGLIFWEDTWEDELVEGLKRRLRRPLESELGNLSQVSHRVLRHPPRAHSTLKQLSEGQAMITKNIECEVKCNDGELAEVKIIRNEALEKDLLGTLQIHREDTVATPDEFRQIFPVGVQFEIVTTIELIPKTEWTTRCNGGWIQ